MADDPEIITDNDNPEWTDADFARAKPFKDVFPEQYGEWKRGRGRPKIEAPKKLYSFRLDRAIVDGIKATGKGFNARVERVLGKALAAGELDAPPDVLKPEPRR